MPKNILFICKNLLFLQPLLKKVNKLFNNKKYKKFRLYLALRLLNDPLILKGSIGLNPFFIDSKITLKEFNIAKLNSYIQKYANLDIKSTKLKIDGKIKKRGKNFEFNSNINLNKIKIDDLKNNEIFNINSLRVKNLKYSKDTLNINKIEITWSSDFEIVDKKGKTNLSKISKNREKKPKKREKSKFKLLINRLFIDNLATNYKNHSLPKELNLYFQLNINSIFNIAKNRDLKSRLDLKGIVGGDGYMRVKGSINIDNFKKFTNIDAKLRNMDIKTLSPYAMKFMGYELKNGWLDIVSKIKVINSKLDIKNKIEISKMKVGKKLNSKSNIALKTAILALKDTNGKIKLNFPISGSVDKPKFKTSSMLKLSVGKTVESIVNAPFKVIVGLLKIKKQIDFIEFDNGEANFIPPSITKLNSVLQMLNKKSHIALSIKKSYNPQIDSFALKNIYITNLIKNRDSIDGMRYILKQEYLKYHLQKDYNKLIEQKVKLKKRKQILLEDARYYVEDIRKSVVNQFGFDRVYKQGFNIKTPINLELQNIATSSLRKGLESYDRRKGWRGALTNKKNSKNWKKNLDKFKLEKSIGWDMAIVKKINKFSTIIGTEKNLKGTINYESISGQKKNLMICLMLVTLFMLRKFKIINMI